MSIEFYNKNAEDFYNGTLMADMSETCEKFLKYVTPSGKILDAGCGSGRDTLYFLKRGYEAVAMDASEQMVRLSTELTGKPTMLMSFEDVDFKEEFDGIWTCASLQQDIKDVMIKLIQGLKDNGIFYGSFKYGEGEAFRGERLFNFYNENSMQNLINEIELLHVIDIWVTQDVRPEREGEKWISCLCRKGILSNVR